jgi:hypothetical protein
MRSASALLAAALTITGAATISSQQPLNLADQLKAGKLRAVNRTVTPFAERPGAVQVAAAEGAEPQAGVVWIEGSDLADGTIEVEVRGRDEMQRSFVGIAFHGKDDKVYEVVYLRPFNFRSKDPARHQHAVQYVAHPDFPWPRLRKEFPEEFENPVDASIEPTGWVPLRIVSKGKTVQIYVGPATAPTLEVRRLGQHDRGLVGLWTDSNSIAEFANLRISAK